MRPLLQQFPRSGRRLSVRNRHKQSGHRGSRHRRSGRACNTQFLRREVILGHGRHRFRQMKHSPCHSSLQKSRNLKQKSRAVLRSTKDQFKVFATRNECRKMPKRTPSTGTWGLSRGNLDVSAIIFRRWGLCISCGSIATGTVESVLRSDQRSLS